ncbi:MAG: ABC transporter substrate-binding protein [Candidatus Hadarchaeum sp.]
MLKSCLLTIIVISLGLLVLGQSIPRERTLIIATGLQPSTLDIGVGYEAAAINVNLVVYERLVRYRPGTVEVEPELASSWSVSQDGKIWTFKLRPGIYFHDGTPCNADAVKFSFDRVLALNLGPAWMFEPIEQIEAVDDLTVQFILKRPYPEFLQVLANIFGTGIVSPAAVKSHATPDDPWAQEWLSANMVGTGPYKFVEWVKGQYIILQRFENYWRGWENTKNNIEQVIIRYITEPSVQRLLIERGDIDIAMDISVDDWEIIKGFPGITLVEKPSMHATYIRFNCASGPTADVRVRKAIRAAMDYTGVIEYILRGHAVQMQGPAALGLPCHNQDLPLPKYDLELARELLAEAGFPNGGFSLEYVYESGHEDRRRVGELLQASLAELGIALRIIELPWPDLWERISSSDPERTPALVANGWWPDYADVINFLYPMYHSSQWPPVAFNIGFYKNQEVDTLLDQALVETDFSIRCELLKKVQTLIFNDCPDIDLYHLTTRIALRNWVKGYVYSPIYTEGFFLYDMWLDR